MRIDGEMKPDLFEIRSEIDKFFVNKFLVLSKQIANNHSKSNYITFFVNHSFYNEQFPLANE